MEKKTYIKPEMMIEVLNTEVLMLAISGDEVNTEEEQLSIGRGSRRGKWGDLWYVED